MAGPTSPATVLRGGRFRTCAGAHKLSELGGAIHSIRAIAPAPSPTAPNTGAGANFNHRPWLNLMAVFIEPHSRPVVGISRRADDESRCRGSIPFVAAAEINSRRRLRLSASLTTMFSWSSRGSLSLRCGGAGRSRSRRLRLREPSASQAKPARRGASRSRATSSTCFKASRSPRRPRQTTNLRGDLESCLDGRHAPKAPAVPSP